MRKMRRLSVGFALPLALGGLLVTQAATAASFSFSGISESSTTDPGPLYGAPTIVGDTVSFSPTGYSASANGTSGFDQTNGELDLFIDSAAPGQYIEQIIVSELGSVSLSGPVGIDATGANVALSATVTILEIGGVPVPFPQPQPFFGGSISPTDTFLVSSHLGDTNWSGNILIDLTSFGNVTRVQLTIDNNFFASSEAVGNSASIQKDSVSIVVIPEPGTIVLLSGGLLALTLRARGRRA